MVFQAVAAIANNENLPKGGHLRQAFAFPSLLQLRMRIEVPVWRDLATARNPTAALPAEEDSASEAERSPGLALPVPVGMVDTFSTSTDAVWAWCPGHR